MEGKTGMDQNQILDSGKIHSVEDMQSIFFLCCTTTV